MKSKTALITMSVACCILASGLVAVAQQAQQARPTSTAVLNLLRIMEQLDERKSIEAELTRQREQLAQRFQEQQATLNAEREQLDQLLEPGSPDYVRRQEELLLKSYRLRAEQQFEAERHARERVLRMQDLHRRMIDRIKQYASDNGYDVVLHTDGDVPLGVERTDQGQINFVNRQRVVYASDAVNLTDPLITVLNNEFQARGE